MQDKSGRWSVNKNEIWRNMFITYTVYESLKIFFSQVGKQWWCSSIGAPRGMGVWEGNKIKPKNFPEYLQQSNLY